MCFYLVLRMLVRKACLIVAELGQRSLSSLPISIQFLIDLIDVENSSCKIWRL
jgi:hypothetical protein